MSVSLAKVDHFERGKYPHKYVAVMKDGSKVRFGHQDYEYKDGVPKRLGGGLWSKRDHLDPVRRKNYRTRHSAVETKSGQSASTVKYSPSWFSYHLLW